MNHTLCEFILFKHLPEELRLNVWLFLSMYCDNQVAIHIALNLVFHMQGNHIYVDCHLVRKKWKIE